MRWLEGRGGGFLRGGVGFVLSEGGESGGGGQVGARVLCSCSSVGSPGGLICVGRGE